VPRRRLPSPPRPGRGRPAAATIGLLACAGALALASCGGGSPPPPPAENAILISIDTLRADRLGCYGYERDTSPAIDRLAAQGVLFRHTVAESSWTLPSHFTMLSGLYPTTHGVENSGMRPTDALELLPEVLSARGWFTAAFTDGGFLSADRGFGQGFLEFSTPADRPFGLESALAAARKAITERAGDRPFFLFIHTYDVHCPYDPPVPYYDMFRSEGVEPIETTGRCGNPHYNKLMDLSPEQARFLSDVYDGGIRWADAHLQSFFDFLAESGLLESTAVVLTSDHGEEFLEHGQIGHERTLYRPSLMIPLIVRAPGVEPRVVDAPAGLVDVVPTLADLLGLPSMPDWEGRSLLPAMRGERLPVANDGFRYSSIRRAGNLDSWLGPDTHLIWDQDHGTVELYDLANDPLERTNLLLERPERAEALRGALAEFVERLEAGRRPVEEGSTTDAQREELRKLGYAGD